MKKIHYLILSVFILLLCSCNSTEETAIENTALSEEVITSKEFIDFENAFVAFTEANRIVIEKNSKALAESIKTPEEVNNALKQIEVFQEKVKSGNYTESEFTQIKKELHINRSVNKSIVENLEDKKMKFAAKFPEFKKKENNEILTNYLIEKYYNK